LGHQPHGPALKAARPVGMNPGKLADLRKIIAVGD
jgi:hypothetical protein